MTAAPALPPQGPAAPGRHRTETASRLSGLKARIHMPARLTKDGRTTAKAVSLAKKSAEARKAVKALPTNPKPVASPPVARLSTVELTDTGKAAFSVSRAGEISKNLFRRSAGGYGTFAAKTGEVLSDAYQEPGWFVQLLETGEQRQRRINVQAVAQVLIITATAAAKLAARKK